MPLIASDTGGGDFKLVPQGTHLAVCNMIVDLGNQKTDWQGQEKIQHKCYIRWEIPSERIEWEDKEGVTHEGPMVIGKQYTVGLGDKYTMKTDFEAWRGKAFTPTELAGFEVKNVLGACCQVNITHKISAATQKEYARVEGLAAWPKGVEKVKAERDLIYYDDTTPEVLDQLPKWAQEAIQNAVASNVTPLPDPEPDNDPLDDDIPF